MNFDRRHKRYGFPEVFEQPKSISLSERSRAHVWAGRGCVPPMPVTLPPAHQPVPTNRFPCSPTHSGLCKRRHQPSNAPCLLALLFSECHIDVSSQLHLIHNLKSSEMCTANTLGKLTSHVLFSLTRSLQEMHDHISFILYRFLYSSHQMQSFFFFSIQPDMNSNE